MGDRVRLKCRADAKTQFKKTKKQKTSTGPRFLLHVTLYLFDSRCLRPSVQRPQCSRLKAVAILSLHDMFTLFSEEFCEGIQSIKKTTTTAVSSENRRTRILYFGKSQSPDSGPEVANESWDRIAGLRLGFNRGHVDRQPLQA